MRISDWSHISERRRLGKELVDLHWMVPSATAVEENEHGDDDGPNGEHPPRTDDEVGLARTRGRRQERASVTDQDRRVPIRDVNL